MSPFCSITSRHMDREFRAIREDPGNPAVFHRTMANALRALAAAMLSSSDLREDIIQAMRELDLPPSVNEGDSRSGDRDG